MSSVLLALIAVDLGNEPDPRPARRASRSSRPTSCSGSPARSTSCSWSLSSSGTCSSARRGPAHLRDRRQHRRRAAGRRQDVARDHRVALITGGAIAAFAGRARRAPSSRIGDPTIGPPTCCPPSPPPSSARPSSAAADSTSGARSSPSTSSRSASRACSWPAPRSGSLTSSTASRCCSPSGWPSSRGALAAPRRFAGSSAGRRPRRRRPDAA